MMNSTTPQRQKFGTKRYKPNGDWIQTSPLIEVVGIAHRYDQVRNWIDAVVVADQKHMAYGVNVTPEPSNPHDSNAILVVGYADSKGILGATSRKSWNIGYIPREIAQGLANDLIAKGIPIAAELYDISLAKADSRSFIDVRILILAPPGYGRKDRLNQLLLAESSIAALADQAKRIGDYSLQEELLVQWCQSEIKMARIQGPAPRPFLELAKLFRKQKRHNDEFDLLEYWDTFPKPQGSTVQELANRLAKLRQT